LTAVVGRSKQERLDSLIGEVARGERTLAEIGDPELREAVRLALRLHEDAADLRTPDEYTRMRMRARIMSGLRPRAPSLRENAWTALWYLGRPAPYIARAIAISAFLVLTGMGATLASADALPDDLLYSVKIAGESMRLALATKPEDRAGVELSIAEHRLAEAERLALSGRTSDALVASAVYSWHIASAAAELAGHEDSTVGAQLESSFNAQRDRAQRLAESLSSDREYTRAAAVIAMIATPTMAPGLTEIERVAETAASLADDFAAAAEHEAASSFQEEQTEADGPASLDAQPQTHQPLATVPSLTADTGARATTSDTGGTPRSVTASPRRSGDRQSASTSTRATGKSVVRISEARASDNAKAARRAAEQARAAAEKLKKALQLLKDRIDRDDIDEEDERGRG
jgi:hypothetical protein